MKWVTRKQQPIVTIKTVVIQLNLINSSGWRRCGVQDAPWSLTQGGCGGLEGHHTQVEWVTKTATFSSVFKRPVVAFVIVVQLHIQVQGSIPRTVFVQLIQQDSTTARQLWGKRWHNSRSRSIKKPCTHAHTHSIYANKFMYVRTYRTTNSTLSTTLSKYLVKGTS
jgi:hypothetical protein